MGTARPARGRPAILSPYPVRFVNVQGSEDPAMTAQSITVAELVRWWCLTLGITDPRIIDTSLGIIAGGSVLLMIYFIISLFFTLLGLRGGR
jgi:hypothetical protein